jgi:tyrosinase
MSRFVVTGASGGSPNRLEINDLVNNEKFFSLYIQALRRSNIKLSHQIVGLNFLSEAMCTCDQDDIQSYFAVAGIHGLPSEPWNGATGDPPFDPTTVQWGGYCTHGSVLFPTWHRPYLMLFEVCSTSFFDPFLVINVAIILLANFTTACRRNRCDIHSRHRGLDASRH